MKDYWEFSGHPPAVNDNERGVRAKPAAPSIEAYRRFEAAEEVRALAEPFYFSPMTDEFEYLKGQK